MQKFTGTFEALQGMVASVGVGGVWSQGQNVNEFRATNGAILRWFPNTGTVQYQGNREESDKLRTALSTLTGESTPIERISSSVPASETLTAGSAKIFIVHGQDRTSLEQLELVLLKLGLEPFVLMNTGGGGDTIIEALEREIVQENTRVRFGIVLVTPDDVGYSKNDGQAAAKPRARQNVVLEMGMLIATLKRKNVAILIKGHVEVPSNAHGILYLLFNDHVREAVPKLCQRLKEAGIDLDPTRVAAAVS